MECMGQGHALDMVRTRVLILQIKSLVLDTIQHDTLPIMKFIGIIASHHIQITTNSSITVKQETNKERKNVNLTSRCGTISLYPSILNGGRE